MDLKGIEDLHRLKTEGVITEEEFEQAKQRLLFGSPARQPAPSPVAGIAAALNRGAPAELPGKDDHLAWALLPLRRYADFTGRSTRQEFWMFQLVPLAVVIVMLVGAGSVDPYAGGSAALGWLAVVSGVIALAGLIVPQLAVQVRRLHDQDRPGTLALINLVPYIGPVIVLVLMLAEGTRGENRFGPDPLAA